MPVARAGRARPEVALVPGYVRGLSRRLRGRRTTAERVLWEALRDRRLHGYKFRRQHPLGRYIADFYCAEAGLVIELDGAVHDDPAQREYDALRDAELQARGLQLLRFRNDEILYRFDNTVQTIAQSLP